VTPEHILIRTAFETTAVPWAQVTGFEGGKDSPTSKDEHKGMVVVLTSGGERLHTAGYAPVGTSPTELWRLLRALEDERLARAPGAASTLPPPPPQPGERGVAAFFNGLGVTVLGVIALLAFGAPFMYGGVTEIGPAFRAVHGGGTAGYFIPGERPGGRAEWFGDFRLTDGTVTRRHTRIADLSKDALHTGVPVAARDTGDPDTVYPRDDQGAWHGPAGVIVAAAWPDAAAFVVIIRLGVLWLRRNRHDDDGNVAPPTQAAGHPDLRTQDARPRASCRFRMPNRLICADGHGHR
jgi:hypothetical protein